jgi:hypothetical protein
VIEPLENYFKNQRDLRDNALRTISIAINETYLYYGGLDRGKSRDYDIEAQLSKYWSAAAIPIRHVDAEFAQICEQKSEYWVNPDGWGEDRIKEVGIQLGKVRQRYRDLIYPNNMRKRLDTWKSNRS